MDHATAPTKAVIYSKHVVAQRWWTNTTNVPSSLKNYPDAWTTSSDLRVWLNGTGTGTFLADFTASERNLMSAAYAKDPASAIGDRVTLPAYDEMIGTGLMGYTVSAGTSDLNRQVTVRGQSTNVRYWLRSSGSDPNSPNAAFVDIDGYVYDHGIDVNLALGVRPASQISLNLIIFKSGSGSESDPYKLYTDWKTTPQLTIETDGKLKLTFTDEITSADKWPAGSDFTLSTPAGNIASVTSDDNNLNVLILSPDVAIAAGTRVQLACKLNVDAAGKLSTGSGAVVKSGDIAAMNGQSWEINKPSPGTNPGGGDSGNGSTTIPVTGITLNLTTTSLATGETQTLTAIITPSTATNKTVTWKSSDENVATVDKNGKITAVGPGICTITATCGGFSASCEVTVTEDTPPGTTVTIDFSGLDLENGVLKLSPGDEVDLTITGTPDGIKFTATGLPEGLILTEDGHLTGTVPEAGTYRVTITATVDGVTVSETFVIEVKDDEIIVTPEGGSGGGCSAGFGALVLLALGMMVKRRG